jgi:glycerate kinase
LYRPDAIDAIFPTATAAKSLEKAIADAASDIEMVSENIGRLIAAMQRK